MKVFREAVCVGAVALAVGICLLATALAWEDSSIAKLLSLATAAVVIVLAGGLGLVTTEPADLTFAGRVAKGLGLWGGESTPRTVVIAACSVAIATMSWLFFGGAMLHLQVDCNEAKSLSWDEWLRPPAPVECASTPQAINAWRPFTTAATFESGQLWCNFAGDDGGPIVRRHPEQEEASALPICLREALHPSSLLASLPPPSPEDAGANETEVDAGRALVDAAVEAPHDAGRVFRDAAPSLALRDAEATAARDAAAVPFAATRSIVMTPGTGFLFDTALPTLGPGAPRHLWWNRVQLVPAYDVLVARADANAASIDRRSFESARVIVPKQGDTFAFLLPTRPPTAVSVHVDGVGDDLRLTYRYPILVR